MLLRAESLSSGYGRLPVLFGVDLAVDAGQIHTVLGPNGAGKSTLARTLARVLPLDDGTITYRDESIDSWDVARAADNGIAYVPQEGSVFPTLSVEENLEVGAGREAGAAEAIGRIYERFPVLAERSAQRASTLSGGERQMLALASAMLMDPQLLVLDEPTSGLAPQVVAVLVDWVTEIAAGGVGVVWIVEQDPQRILERSTTATVITSGSVSYQGPPADLTNEALMAMMLETP